MALVVLLTICGILAMAAGVVVMLMPVLTVQSLIASLPFFLAGFVLFGLSEVIRALLRTADASEAMVKELRKITNRQQPSQR